ncbi:MAG TPA: phage tail sheath subtilisin-like domain-containing protein, partial [Urbifossiella sp.]|nr:phage tail sheath subtilisin-like domain-containing protein [Urbifossiella sp.]
MPAALSYPGVYVEEIPSGVHTITGVATSITAFVGRTQRGPINTATPVLSYADYQRTFGNITSNAPVAYAVRDFFLNGGSQAVIVRLFTTATPTAAAAVANGGLTLSASSPGDWGANLLYACDQTTPKQSGNFFNLSVYQKNPADSTNPTLLERFTSLSTSTADTRRADLILAAQSNYVQAAISTTATPVTPTTSNVAFTGGTANAVLTDASYIGGSTDTFQADKKGLYALEQTDLFNLLCIPPDSITGDTSKTVYDTAGAYCTARRAVLIVDPPSGWDSGNGRMVATFRADPLTALGNAASPTKNAAVYFPRVRQNDPANNNQEATFSACGIVAGLYAQTDTDRGVWKAPAGVDTTILGINSLAINLTDAENGLLNPVGINCLRFFKASGNVVWGARTLRGSDQLADDYKYVPVRRL